MGLFDAFGVGGGSMAIQLQSSQVQAGSGFSGLVVFTGGKRAQKITNIKVRLSRTVSQTTKGPQGAQQSSRVEQVVPEYILANAFTSQPGQPQQFQFQMQIPAGSPSSTQGLVSYALSASADIDGEVDPGAHAELQVFGVPYMDQGAQQMGYIDPNMGGYADPYGKGQPDKYSQGEYVDPKAGGFGKGGYEDTKAGGFAKPDPYGKGGYVDPNEGGYGKGGYVDPKAGSYGTGGYDPNAGSYGKADPYGKGAMGGGIGVGSHVQAPWNDGQYYGATVQQENGGMYLVQWDDGSPASWVDGSQVSPG